MMCTACRLFSRSFADISRRSFGVANFAAGDKFSASVFRPHDFTSASISAPRSSRPSSLIICKAPLGGSFVRVRDAYLACASGEARSFVHETILSTVSRLAPFPNPRRCAGEGVTAVWLPARPPPIAINSRTRARIAPLC